jgi:hypothetical protein
MIRYIAAAILVAGLALSQASCVLRPFALKSEPEPVPVQPLKGYATLDKMPFREAWYGMYFQEEKVGFSHFRIEPSGRNFRITSDSLMRMTALKKTNEINMKEKVMVRPDLTLIAFESLMKMDGKDLRMVGRQEGDRFWVDISVEGQTVRQEYPVSGNLYHTSAISLMPAVRGLKDGEKYSFGVFNPGKQGVENVEQEVAQVQGKPGPNGAVWRVKNNYDRSQIYAWLDGRGLTVLEKALEGSLITMLEDQASAQAFLNKKGPGKDLVLDFSLIRVANPIPQPEKVRFLKIEMEGIDSNLIASDHRQTVTVNGKKGANEPFAVQVRSETPAIAGKAKGRADSVDLKEHLESTISIQSSHPEIVAQAGKIVDPGDADMEKVVKLVKWTAKNIKNRMKDSFTALSVLRAGEGECQSHANLYTALARSQKIPTRIVTGLVYTEDVGFLYHAWAESFVNGSWVSVDPTLDQIPADATHIKIASGESGKDMSSLLKMVGKVKIKVLEFKS